MKKIAGILRRHRQEALAQPVTVRWAQFIVAWSIALLIADGFLVRTLALFAANH